MPEPLTFRAPPTPDAFEWSGTIVGVSNTLTRVRGPVVIDRSITPVRCDDLVQLARRAISGDDAYIHDAVIHGLGVRLFSDSHHAADFFRDTWLSPQDWRERSGLVPPAKPRLTVYAMGTSLRREPGAFVSEERNVVVISGATWFGTLRDLVMHEAARILAEEQGVLLCRAAAILREGRATVIAGRGRTARVFRGMEDSTARHVSDKGVAVRFAYLRRAGGWVAPVAAAGSRETGASGAGVFAWIAANSTDGKARVSGVDQDLRPIELDLEDLNALAPQAFAYPVERAAYVRTSLVKEFPQHAWTFIRSKLENAPEVPAGAADTASGFEEMAKAAAHVPDPAARVYFDGLAPSKLRDLFLRLTTFEGTRALVDPEKAFGRGRVARNPAEGWPVAAVEGDLEGPEELRSLLRSPAGVR